MVDLEVRHLVGEITQEALELETVRCREDSLRRELRVGRKTDRLRALARDRTR